MVYNCFWWWQQWWWEWWWWQLLWHRLLDVRCWKSPLSWGIRKLRTLWIYRRGRCDEVWYLWYRSRHGCVIVNCLRHNDNFANAIFFHHLTWKTETYKHIGINKTWHFLLSFRFMSCALNLENLKDQKVIMK